MKFKDWFDEKIIEIDDPKEYVEKFNYVATTLDIVKKVYNLFKDTKLIDYIDIVYDHDNHTDIFNYIIVFTNNLFDFKCVLDTVMIFNNIERIKHAKEDIGYFENTAISNPYHLDLDDDFYCLLTVNPNKYIPEYIIELEEYLNEGIDGHTVMMNLYNQFTTKLESDKDFANLLSTIYNDFAIVCFESEDELNEYNRITRLSIDNLTSFIRSLEDEDNEDDSTLLS